MFRSKRLEGFLERHPYFNLVLVAAMTLGLVGYEARRVIASVPTVSEAQAFAGVAGGLVAGFVMVSTIFGLILLDRSHMLHKGAVVGPAMVVWVPLFVWTHPESGSSALTSAVQVGIVVFMMTIFATLPFGAAWRLWRRARQPER